MKTKVHFLQTYIVLLSGIAAMLFSASCSESDSPSTDLIADTSVGETSRVEILIPQNITTRTQISEDSQETLAVEWGENDELALWSRVTGDGANPKGPSKFTYLAQSFDEINGWALFYCKEIEIPANRSNYTYYAVSPAPKESNGTTAYFTVPAEQNGEYAGSVPDILWAPPVEAKCLTANLRNQINFAFEHVLHALKITVPVVPFEGGIKQVRIEFPYAVAGKLGIDLTNGSTSLTEGSNAITLTFDKPKQVNETFWVFVAPTAGAVSGEVHFIATDGTDFTYPKTSSAFKLLDAGHITPVKLNNLTKRPQEDFTVKITENHLGEPITIAAMTLPAGGSGERQNVFPSLEQLNSTQIHLDGKTEVKIKMFSDVVERLNNMRLTAVLESQHAEDFEVSNTVANKSISFSAPYLFFEDFSTVEGFSADDEWKVSSPGDKKYGPFLDGWSGGRIGAMAGTAIRIACRRETSSDYDARVDSAPIKHLKSGSTVKVSVQYDYGMDRWGGMFSGSRNGGANVGQTVHLGYIKDSSVHNSGSTTITEVSNFTIKELAPSGGQDAGYTHITHTDGNFQIPDCDKETRMTWRTTIEHKAGADNNTCWFYLDNIKVSIVP